MKTNIFLCGVFLVSAVASANASTEAPSGEVFELHSLEVLTAGCIASSEYPQEGRSLLRIWLFENGVFDEADLAGKAVALLQVSEDNLTAGDGSPNQAVAYLPEAATESQRRALLKWLQEHDKSLSEVPLKVTVLPFDYTLEGAALKFSAGETIRLETAVLRPSEGGCGEQLWYDPRTSNNGFQVLLNLKSSVVEPYLQLTWKDFVRRSVFLAGFGPAKSAK